MPPGQRRYEVQLSSKSGPIDVFLIQDQNTNNTTNNNEQNHPNNNNNSTPTTLNNNNTTHFSESEIIRPFGISLDAFAFDMKNDEGASDIFGINGGDSGGGGGGGGGNDNENDVYNVFSS